MGSTFWKFYNHIQLLCWGTGLVIQELDSCDSVDEESSCPLAEQINVFFTQPFAELKLLHEGRKLSLQELLDICTDNRVFNCVKNKDFCQQLQELEAEP